MKKALLPICTVLVWFGVACTTNTKVDSVQRAQEQNDKVPGIDANTSQFLTRTASNCLMQIQMGEEAQKNAEQMRVKDFGLMMIHDFSSIRQQLQTIAAHNNITLPQTTSNDNSKHVAELEKQKGKEFDKSYMDMMLLSNKGEMNTFIDASHKAELGEVKRVTQQTIPLLQAHIDSIKQIKEFLYVQASK